MGHAILKSSIFLARVFNHPARIQKCSKHCSLHLRGCGGRLGMMGATLSTCRQCQRRQKSFELPSSSLPKFKILIMRFLNLPQQPCCFAEAQTLPVYGPGPTSSECDTGTPGDTHPQSVSHSPAGMYKMTRLARVCVCVCVQS